MTKTSLVSRDKKELRRVELLGGASVAVLGMLIVLLFFSADGLRYAMRSPEVAAVVSSVIVDLTNGDRTGNELSTLTVNPRLVAAAQAKANDMASKGYFAHVAPDGTDPWHFFDIADYKFDYAGENLAIDFSDSEDVERAWMHSPAHRENILNAHFTEIGIATASGMYQGRMTTFVVQEFGTPKGTYRTQVDTATVPADPSQLAIVSARKAPVAKAPVKAENKQVLGISKQEVTSPEVAQNVSPKMMENTLVAAVNPAPAMPDKVPLWAYLISFPHDALRYAYYFMGLVVLVMLAFATRFEMRKHHIRHATGAMFLVGLMGVLFVVANYTIFAAPVLSAALSQ